MAVDAPLPVQTGTFWIDRTQGWLKGSLFTVTDSWNTFISLVVGIVFALAQPSMERIVAHLLAYFCYKLPKSRRLERIEARANRTSSLSGPQQSEEHLLQERAELQDDRTPLLTEPRQNRSTFRRWCFSRWNYCYECCTRATAAKLLSWAMVLAFTVAGAFVTGFSAEGPALSASNRLGAWGLRDDANNVALDEDALIQGEKESRAGQYARDCYGSQTSTGLSRCSIFLKERIPTSQMMMRQQCPFDNKTYCPGDSFTAVKFTTGQVEARNIGINRYAAPTFNRTTVCTPLNLAAGFVQHLEKRGEYGYDLGPVAGDLHRSPYTFHQLGDPWYYDVRAYTMSTYYHVYAKASHQNYWQPSPALRLSPHLITKSKPYSITLMFINSCRILYEASSDDWVFPAQEPRKNSTSYWNIDSRARPLACIDWIELCKDPNTCATPDVEDPEAASTYEFTRFALNKSTAFHAIAFRGATGLDAQYRIQGDTSLPLSSYPPQWVLESWGLFNTSLSRIQYDAFDIANGTNGDDNALYVQKMPSRAQRNLYGLFIFQPPKGYKNIRVYLMILVGFLLPCVFVAMAWKTDAEFSEEKKQSGWFQDMKLMAIEKVLYDAFGPSSNSVSPIATHMDTQVSAQTGRPEDVHEVP